MIFVTAIYSNNCETVVGGRGRGIEFFLPSLINIANLGHDLVLYCTKENADRYRSLLFPFFKNLYVFEYELEQFEYYKQYMDWKRTFYKDVPNDRNEILCFGKMYWLKDAIEKNLSKDGIYMWIDAGLTHHGIIPEKVGGVELLRTHPVERYFPYNSNNIFNSKLGQNLLKNIQKEKLFYCALPAQGDHSKLQGLTEKVFQKNSLIIDHLIGGIFGGYSQDILRNFSLYEKLFKETIDSKLHCFEEHLFNCLYSVFPEQYILHKFDIWWFYSPGEITSYLTEDANSFYKILKRIHDQE